MQHIEIGDIIESEDDQFLFKIIDEGEMGRGVKYIGSLCRDDKSLHSKDSPKNHNNNKYPKYFEPVTLKKDINIAEFIGEIITWNEDLPKTHKTNKEFEKKRKEHEDYLVALDRKELNLLIPTTDKDCVAFLINTKQKQNNCKISIHNKRAFIKTIKNIEPGDTLYVDYGASYIKRMNKKK